MNSIKTTARIGGLLSGNVRGSMFTVILVRGSIIVSGNAEATANNIMASQLLWRIGIVADLIMHVLDIPIMLVIYILLKPVNKDLALLALLFNLIQTAVLVANKLNLVAALLPLDRVDYLKSIESHQLYAQRHIFHQIA